MTWTRVMKKPVYCVLHARTMNLDLVKDLGFMPHTFGSDYGYDARLVTYPNDDFSWRSLIPGAQVIFLKKQFGEFVDVMAFLARESRSIDVLHLEHLQRNDNLLFGLTYKILCPRGVLYYKLDASPQIMQALVDRPNDWKSRLKTRFLKWMLKNSVDLISVEDCRHFDALRKEFSDCTDKILHLPNGYYIPADSDVSITRKQRWIFTSARIGAYQKASDVLLEAFAAIAHQIPDWRLILAGPIEPAFEAYLDSYFAKHPELRRRVELLGYVTDRRRLNEYYAQAGIFCFPSRWEGFSHALIEAGYFGDYIVATRVGGAEDLLRTTHYGTIVPFDDVPALASALRTAIESGSLNARNPREVQQIVADEFSWTHLCGRLHEKLTDLLEQRSLRSEALD